MNDYFIDPLGRGPKGLPPPHGPEFVHRIGGGGGARVNANYNVRDAMGPNTMMAPIFPDAGFESSHSIGNVPIMLPQHLISSPHRTTTTHQCYPTPPLPLQQLQQQQRYKPNDQLPIPTSAESRHYLPNDEIPPSPMQVYMLSSATINNNNKCSNHNKNNTSTTSHYRDAQSFRYDNIPPPSTNCQNYHELHYDDAPNVAYPKQKQHLPSDHHHHHPAHDAIPKSYHHSHNIDSESDGHRCAKGGACHLLESTRQSYPQRSQQQHSYNHPGNTHSDPPAPPPPTQQRIDEHCRLVSSDSETVFHQNGHNQFLTKQTNSSQFRNTRLCCGGGGVVGEDHPFCRKDRGYHPHHNYHHCRYNTSPDRKCLGNACRYHHPPHEEYREYDPSTDIRIYGRADSHQRHEFRDPPPPSSSLPLSPITIPSVVNSPAVAQNRRCGCEGGLHNDYHDGLDGKRMYHGYHSCPHTSAKLCQDHCHSYHDCRYDHDHHPSTPSPHRHLPPPPPPPSCYKSPHYVDQPSRQQQYSYPDESSKSRLSVEIPHSPPHIPNQHTTTVQPPLTRRPFTHHIIHDSRSTTPTRSTTSSSARTNQKRQAHPSSSFAEYEKRQSEARQQLLREIGQATTMRNSALEEEDRKFWDRQIDTLNHTFRKL